jgi:hypothetical protein
MLKALVAITCGLFRRQSGDISKLFVPIISRTYIDPNRALTDQASFCAVLQLCGNKTQHILTATEKTGTGGIVNVSLGFVEAFLHIVSSRDSSKVVSSCKSVLLAS